MTINPESGSIGPPHTPVTTAEGRSDMTLSERWQELAAR
jgi:hypothetical protein